MDKNGYFGWFSKTLRKYDSIWVIVHRLAKLSHFILVRVDYNMATFAKIYVKEILRLYGGTDVNYV